LEVADRGETRRIDVGVADEEPFVVSPIAGLPAEASADASHELKKRFGTLAFVLEGFREVRAFDELYVEIHATTEGEEFAWSGEALALLVGNLRRFTKVGGQANAEDGLLEVAIVERMPPTDAVAEAIEQRLFHQDTPP
jgi:diacylglycerol kinase family enzyme